MEKIDNPKVFISYAWTNDSYSKKVRDFCDRLISVGIDVLLDKYENSFGVELNSFMEKSVQDNSVTNVLMLLNPHYKEKADKRHGGVGTETQIISGKVYSNVEQTKFIPVIFERENKSISDCLPIYLNTRYYCDLTNEVNYEEEFMNLVKILYGEEEYIKPNIGNKPSWVSNRTTKLNLSYTALDAISKANTQTKVNDVIIDSLNRLLEQIRSINIGNNTEDFNEVNFISSFSKLLPYRNAYIDILYKIANEDIILDRIWEFFEEFNKIANLHYGSNNMKKNMYDTIIHEFIIYTIAILFKKKNYKAIGDLISIMWINHMNGSEEANFNQFFYSYILDDHFRTVYSKRDGKRYFIGSAMFWNENVYEPLISQIELANADILIANLTISNSSNERSAWFAKLYIYSGFHGRNDFIKELAISLKSKRLSQRYYGLFGVKSQEELKGKIKSIHNFSDNLQYRYGYSESFVTIPLLSTYIKVEDVGAKD